VVGGIGETQIQGTNSSSNTFDLELITRQERVKIKKTQIKSLLHTAKMTLNSRLHYFI